MNLRVTVRTTFTAVMTSNMVVTDLTKTEKEMAMAAMVMTMTVLGEIIQADMRSP